MQNYKGICRCGLEAGSRCCFARCAQEAEGGALLIAAYMRTLRQLRSDAEAQPSKGAQEEGMREVERRLLAFCRRYVVSALWHVMLCRVCQHKQCRDVQAWRGALLLEQSAVGMVYA